MNCSDVTTGGVNIVSTHPYVYEIRLYLVACASTGRKKLSATQILASTVTDPQEKAFITISRHKLAFNSESPER